jgi:hypothetical protein
MNAREIAGQWIALMGHVEEICEKHGLASPVEVNIVDADGNQHDFDYSPEDDRVDLPPASIYAAGCADLHRYAGRPCGTAAVGPCTVAGIEKALRAVREEG